MKQISALLLCACISLPLSSAHAVSWHVPTDAPTIQAGIDSASAGDTVLVACGTYYEHDIVMKSGITLRSETGQADCVTIDAQELGRVILCEEVDATTRIEGLTMTGGVTGDDGGGLLCVHSSPTLTHVTFSGNSADHGGGMSCWDSSSPKLTNISFSANSADGGGGGMFCYLSYATLISCTFSGNSTAAWGGGVRCLSSSASLTQCSFSSNSAVNNGGGMHCQSSSAEFISCTFRGNSAERGGGINCKDTDATLTNCTFYGNSAELAGGIHCWCSTYCALENTIVAFGTQGEAVTCSDAESSAALVCCDIYGNAGGDWAGCIAAQQGVDGNISECPQFCDPLNDNFYLSETSPCVTGYGCGQMGAYGVGCTTGEPSAVEPSSWSALKALYR